MAPQEGGELRPGLFEIDSLPGRYAGWSRDAGWNGWACPLFEYAEAARIAEDYGRALRGEAPDPPVRYDRDTDTFRFYDPALGEWEEYEGRAVGDLHAYPIGTAYWAWSEGDSAR